MTPPLSIRGDKLNMSEWGVLKQDI